jgi:enolase
MSTSDDPRAIPSSSSGPRDNRAASGDRADASSSGGHRGDRAASAGGAADCLIRALRARRVWDSRGRPTVEAEIELAGGAVGRAIVPAGASKGSREAHELRDGGAPFGGLDVLQAVANVETEIARAVLGLRADDQAALDERLVELDGTPTKSRLGANATLAVSMAAAHAAAAARRVPLHEYLGGAAATLMPLPQIQIFGGGAHAGRRVDIQDFMVVCPAARSFAEALEWTAEVYRPRRPGDAGARRFARRRRRGRLVA